MRAEWTHCVGEPGAEQVSAKLFTGLQDNLQGDCAPCLVSLNANFRYRLEFLYTVDFALKAEPINGMRKPFPNIESSLPLMSLNISDLEL